MLYFLGMISCILSILVFANRLWVKRRIKFERIINILILIALFFCLIIITTNFIKNKEEILKIPYEEELKILDEQGNFYVFDENGNVIKKEATIGEMLSDYFIKDVFNANTNIPKSEYLKNNITVIVISAILFIYWITLLILYEKEEVVFRYEQIDDLEILNKYNPMIAACISQNRNIMGRDIIAVILKLIEVGKISLRIVPNQNTSKIKYNYMISEGKNSEYRLDFIEKLIYEWLFEGIEKYIKKKQYFNYIKVSEEGIIEIDLIQRIRSFSIEEGTYSKLEELRYMAKDRLKRVGANSNSVPFLLKVFNNLLMFFVLMIAANHIVSNGLGIVINNMQVVIIMFIAIFLLAILPIIYIFSLIILKTIMVFFKSVEEISEKHTGRNLISKSISIILGTVLLMGIVLLLPIDIYLVYDVLIIGAAFLVVKTDDYMLKHNGEILKDYYNLKRIENKIQDYSLLKEKNIEYIKTWDKYYAYSVALGVPIEVNKESFIDYNIDTNLIINKYDMQGIYSVCKNYLEVMWDFEFDNNRKIIKKINELKKFVNM